MNRNAGGPQYFKYIIEMEDMNHEKFKIMNQFLLCRSVGLL